MDDRHIFIEAINLPTPEERAAYLDEACGDDTELRRRVELLLAAHEDAGSFLEKSPEELLATLDRQDEADLDSWKELLTPSDKDDCLGLLGRYEILELIGRGGMGVVLSARDPQLNRIVAIKMLAPELAAQPVSVRRFLREAQAVAAVSHDHVITIHAVDEQARPPLIVMERVAGQSLQDKIDKEGPLDVKSILRIGMQTASGLAAAHKQGLIHRDIKPSNILLENGIERVKLTDFGLARAVDDVGMTRTGQITGTPQYMSPEQAQGHPVDHRTDLFSLGCVLYAMCTGQAAFRADSAVAVMHRVVHDAPKPIREINEDIPDWLCRIVEKLMAKDPKERFASASEVEDLLGRHLAHLQQPESVPLPEKIGTSPRTSVFTDPQRRSRMIRTGLIVVLLAYVGTELTGVTHGVIRTVDNFNGKGRIELTSLPGDAVVRGPDAQQNTQRLREGLGSPDRLRTFSTAINPSRYEIQFYSDEHKMSGLKEIVVERGHVVSVHVPKNIVRVDLAQSGPAMTRYAMRFDVRLLDPLFVLMTLLAAITLVWSIRVRHRSSDSKRAVQSPVPSTHRRFWKSHPVITAALSVLAIVLVLEQFSVTRVFDSDESATLSEGTLRVASDTSDVSVSITGEGVSIASALPMQRNLPPGRYKIVVSKSLGNNQFAHYSAYHQITAGRTTDVYAALLKYAVKDRQSIEQFIDDTPDAALLRISVKDPELRVMINGVEWDIAGQGEQVVPLKPGGYEFIGVKGSVREFDQAITLQPGDKRILKLETRSVAAEAPDWKQLLSEAASIPLDEWNTLSGDVKGPSPAAIRGEPLSLVLLNLNPFDAAKENDKVRQDFWYLTETMPKPNEIANAISISRKKSYVSFLQPQYIAHIKVNEDGDSATGHAGFFVPKLYSGRVEFQAARQDGRWNITEFTLPNYSIVLRPNEQGLWQREPSAVPLRITIGKDSNVSIDSSRVKWADLEQTLRDMRKHSGNRDVVITAHPDTPLDKVQEVISLVKEYYDAEIRISKD